MQNTRRRNNAWRIRVGDCRVLYEVIDDALVVFPPVNKFAIMGTLDEARLQT